MRGGRGLRVYSRALIALNDARTVDQVVDRSPSRRNWPPIDTKVTAPPSAVGRGPAGPDSDELTRLVGMDEGLVDAR